MSIARQIVCVKHGNKYSSEYVNTLYRMTQRHCTLEYQFVCLTDNCAGLLPQIKTIPLPSGVNGWWCKLYMFSKEIDLCGTVLYMDLDVVIAENIDKLFGFSPNNWCTIRDFNRVCVPNWSRYNSSVVRFEHAQLAHVWNNFKLNQKSIEKRLHGDQDWLFEATRECKPVFYPDHWIMSWKWEIRKSKEFAPGGIRGTQTLKYIEHVVPPSECCITVFHGDPNPDMCADPWVLNNWQ